MAKQIFIGNYSGTVYTNNKGRHYTDDVGSVYYHQKLDLKNTTDVAVKDSINKVMVFLIKESPHPIRHNRPVGFYISPDFHNYFSTVKKTIESYFTKATVSEYTDINL